MIALLHKMSCKEKIRGMGEEEAMQITGTLQSSFLSELKIFFLMRAEKPHVSRSSSHTHSRLALQNISRGGSRGMFSWCRKPILVRLTMGTILGFGSAEQGLGDIFVTITVDRNLSYFFIPLSQG